MVWLSYYVVSYYLLGDKRVGLELWQELKIKTKWSKKVPFLVL